MRNTHVFAAACGIILFTICAAGILLSEQLPILVWISSITVIIFLVYLISIWAIFKFENKFVNVPEEKLETPSDIKLLRRTVTLYGLNALIVVGAALFLPYFGENIAGQSGMGNTFFGTLFLAASTSLPELVVSISALRMGSLDMAVGNLFGSNIFNIFILGLDDLFYREGSLFANIDQSHILSIMAVIAMTAVAMIGLLFKAERKKYMLGLDTFIIILLYASLMFVLYNSMP